MLGIDRVARLLPKRSPPFGRRDAGTDNGDVSVGRQFAKGLIECAFTQRPTRKQVLALKYRRSLEHRRPPRGGAVAGGFDCFEKRPPSRLAKSIARGQRIQHLPAGKGLAFRWVAQDE